MKVSGAQLRGAAERTLTCALRGAPQLCVRLHRPVRPAAGVRPERSAHRRCAPAASTWQPRNTPRRRRQREIGNAQTSGRPAVVGHNVSDGAMNSRLATRSGGARPSPARTARHTAAKNLERRHGIPEHGGGQSGSHGCGLTSELTGDRREGTERSEGPPPGVRVERPVRGHAPPFAQTDSP